MQHTVTCDFKRDMFFEADVDGHKIGMDASKEFGGKNLGPRPKPLMLAALGGCSGIDVVSLLNKMRVPFSGLRISAQGTLTETEPKYYDQIHVVYEISGKDLPKDKVEKAIALSQEKHCGVIASLKKAATITYEVKYYDKL